MIRLALRVRSADAELVLAELLELAPGGVEEAAPEPGLVEFAVYGSPGEVPQLPAIRAAVGEALVEVSSSVLDDDWAERWKRFHKPVLIDSPLPARVPALCVRPPWEPPTGRDGVLEITIDPGRAFGTGAHATTKLCLELLLELTAERTQPDASVAGEDRYAHTAPDHARASPHRGQDASARACGTRNRDQGASAHARGTANPLLDLGTGSGVLAIAAAGLGYRPVWALDNDPDSVAAASENAQINGAGIQARLFDLRREPLPRARAAVMLANLVRPLLLQLAPAVGERSPEHLIAGGLLSGELHEVVGAFQRAGMRERARRCEAGWAAVWLQA